MCKFAILIKAKFQDALNYRAENTKGRVGKHFLPMYSAELKEKEFGKKQKKTSRSIGVLDGFNI